MLKRNLIVIAIVTLGLGITNAFGQDFDHNPRPKSVRKGTVKKPSKTRVNQTQTQKTRKPNTSGLTDLDANKTYLRQSSNAGSSSRTRKPDSKSPQTQSGLLQFEIQDHLMAKKPTTKGNTGNSGGTVSNQRTSNSSSRTRRPASRSTNQKIVKKPVGWSWGETNMGTQVRRVKKP